MVTSLEDSSNVNQDNPAVAPRYPAKVFVIQSAQDVERLKKPRGFSRRPRVFVRIPGLPIEKAVDWELQLNANLRECGCSLGAQFVFIGLAASVFWQFVFLSWDISRWPWFFVRTILTMLMSGAAGKLLGIALAEARIRRIANKICDFVEKSSTEEHDHVDMHKVG
jgi:hypothetical protein